MWQNIPLWPEQASTIASRVDTLYYALVGLSVIVSGLIFLLLLWFAIRYRRRSDDEQPRPHAAGLWLEVTWTVVPLVVVIWLFLWGAKLYVALATPPADALEIAVVAKQWMWKFQHPEGAREINELHVPVGWPVKLTMTSQDVIHSLYVPAFRTKMDVVPGRYTSLWFEATKPGEYHLFCAEYCGTAHAGMGGRIIAMTPTSYQQWLGGGVRGEPMALAGERLFQQLGCETCHRPGGRGPVLAGLFGATVELQSGDTIQVDESYLRESILNPRARVVAGYQPIMPTFAGQISEEGLTQIIAYIKSLAAGAKDTES